MSLSKARHPYNTDITEAFNMRSLGQGNIFRSMYHSVYGGGVFDVTSCLSGCLVRSLSLVPCSFWGISVQGGLCPEVESLSRSGVSVQEGSLCPGVKSLSRGTSVWGRVSVQGVSVRGGLCQRDPQQRPPRMVKGARYASYWNAFLFFLLFELDKTMTFMYLKLQWSASNHAIYYAILDLLVCTLCKNLSTLDLTKILSQHSKDPQVQ